MKRKIDHQLLSINSMDKDATSHLLIIGDALKVLRDTKYFPDKSIDLIVTSPPYGLRKNYGNAFHDNFDVSSWVNMIETLGKQAWRILKPKGSFFINVSPIPHHKTKEIIPLDSYAYFALKKHGFYLRNKIIWHFNNMQNCTRRLSGRWEAVLWLVKDIHNYVFYLDAIRVPYLTNDKRIKGVGRNPTDVWYFDRVNNMTKKKLGINHPCIYPEPMIERIVKMSSHPGDLVLDPFVGSGTTMKVARLLNRNSTGIEINPEYEEMVRRRVELENPYGKCIFKVVRYSD